MAGPQYIPSRGDRIEQTRLGIRRTGTVWYADQLQLLVKWDEGGSSSLTLGAAGVRILERDSTPASAKVSQVARLRVRDPELVPELIAFLHSRSDLGAARMGKTRSRCRYPTPTTKRRHGWNSTCLCARGSRSDRRAGAWSSSSTNRLIRKATFEKSQQLSPLGGSATRARCLA